MTNETSTMIYLKDYREPDFLITHSDLDVTLGFESTFVHGQHSVIRKNKQALILELNCENMEIQSVVVDGKELNAQQYSQSKNKLQIKDVAAQGVRTQGASPTA